MKPDAGFTARILALEAAYLASDDPIVQSGYSGGSERWRAKRSPILQGIAGDGDLLDVGCANGWLLRCLVDWGAERGLRLTPHGVDIGARLIAEAMHRHPGLEANFHVADAWDWRPPRRYRYVYSLYDVSPDHLLGSYVRLLLDRVVEPRGRLILGAYGSRSAGTPPFDIPGFLAKNGYTIAGKAMGGEPPVTSFAWLDNS